ncbi:MAG: hypothetical protein GXY68_02645 [Chloroflexi bacterium]|jgi:hypothetical protein|nr:hypothetical protein [Chloroflexota bacterium]
MGFLKRLFGGIASGEDTAGGDDAARVQTSAGKVLEADLSMEMVDFYREHAQLIAKGLASSPSDVESRKFYRIRARRADVIKPQHILRLRAARVICDGKLQGLGCSGSVAATHPAAPSDEGHLLLRMRGVLDATSKTMVSCTCGTTFLVYADATVGQRGECYLAVVRLQQPAAARLPVVPFFEADGVDVLSP